MIYFHNDISLVTVYMLYFRTNDVSLLLCLHEDCRNEDNTGHQHAAACLPDPGGEWP